MEHIEAKGAREIGLAGGVDVFDQSRDILMFVGGDADKFVPKRLFERDRGRMPRDIDGSFDDLGIERGVRHSLFVDEIAACEHWPASFEFLECEEVVIGTFERDGHAVSVQILFGQFFII